MERKMCVLDETKICDNCMKCLQTSADYRAIEIDEIIDDGSGAAEYQRLREDLADTDGEQPFDCFKKEQ